MTVRQCAEYLSAQAQARRAAFTEQAILCDGLSVQIMSGYAQVMDVKNRAKRVPLEKLYPDLFKPEEQKPLGQQEIWLKFLFG